MTRTNDDGDGRAFVVAGWHTIGIVIVTGNMTATVSVL